MAMPKKTQNAAKNILVFVGTWLDTLFIYWMRYYKYLLEN